MGDPLDDEPEKPIWGRLRLMFGVVVLGVLAGLILYCLVG